jgi:hypothetical protein
MTHYHYEIKLPICNKCKKLELRHKVKWIIIALIGVPIVFGIISYLAIQWLKINENIIEFISALGVLFLYFSVSIIKHILGVTKNSFAGMWINGKLLKINNKDYVNIFLKLNPQYSKKDENTIDFS